MGSMPDSYGICLTLVVFLGFKKGLALRMIILAPTRMATIKNKKIGVYSSPMDQPLEPTIIDEIVNPFTKSHQKKSGRAPGITVLWESRGRMVPGSDS